MNVRVEVDGHPATVDDLLFPLLVNYGHVTMMQVRGGGTRGLDLHLDRLSGATRELYDRELDTDLVRAHIRHALADGTVEASVRVGVFLRDGAEHPSVLVAVRPPGGMSGPQALKSVPYQRPLAHLKHVGSFGQAYYAEQVHRQGFDEALLTGPDGVITETAIANIGFVDGDQVVWPEGPMLAGVTMQLLDRVLGPLPRRRIALDDLGGFQAAFVSNSLGIAPVSRIDDHRFDTGHAVLTAVAWEYDAVPFDPIQP